MNSSNFQERLIRIGALTLCIGIVANFIPAAFLAIFYGVLPPINDIFQLWLVAFGAFGASWIVQPLSYYPMLGISGSYIAWLCGNVADIRIPAATMAQKVTGAEANTPKGDIMATIGISASVFVSVIILTICTFIGTTIIALLPAMVIKSFNFIIPAVFGAIYADLGAKHTKLSAGTMVIALAITFGSAKLGIPAWLLPISTIAVGGLLARWLFEADKKTV